MKNEKLIASCLVTITALAAVVSIDKLHSGFVLRRKIKAEEKYSKKLKDELNDVFSAMTMKVEGSEHANEG